MKRILYRTGTASSILGLCVALMLLQPLRASAQDDPENAYESEFVNVGDVRLEYLDFGGEGLPVLFIPSQSQDARSWGGFAPRFTDQHRALALSPRGQGESEDTGQYDIATNARDVIGFLDSLGIADAILVGKGEVMTYLAERHPGRVAGLVYLVPFPPLIPPDGGWNQIDPTGGWEMIVRASGSGPLTTRRRAVAEDEYRHAYWNVEGGPSIEIPALAFVTSNYPSVREGTPPPPIAFAQAAAQGAFTIEDSLAQAYFKRLAVDEELQERVWAFHREVFIPGMQSQERAFRRAFGDHLRLVRLDRAEVSGYEYITEPELIEPHVRRFLEEVRAQRNPQDDILAQIAELDARYFDAHNRCDLEALRAFLAPDMEAYHDLGGYLQGREAFMEVMEGFCSHPEHSRRELTPGTLEAYRLAGVGAMHMADHRFHMVESGADMGSGKMIIIWRLQDDEWQVFRIISYDHKPASQ